MSPSVQCLSVRMPRCSFQADSMLNATFSSLQAGMGPIPFGIDPFSSDLTGMPLSLLRLFSAIKYYSVLVIMLQFFHSFLYDLETLF